MRDRLELEATHSTPRAIGLEETTFRVITMPSCASPSFALSGVPFSRGLWDGSGAPHVVGPLGAIASAFEVTDRWSDGSVRWALVDLVLPPNTAHGDTFAIRLPRAPGDAAAIAAPLPLRVDERDGGVDIDTGALSLRIEPGEAFPFSAVNAAGTALLAAGGARLALELGDGRGAVALIRTVQVEHRGPLRAVVRIEGDFPVGGASPLVFFARLQCSSGSASVRMQLTTRNPRRAVHAGGHWELGDPGSVLVRDLALLVDAPGCEHVAWTAEPSLPAQERSGAKIEIFQDSSGGEHWKSRVHLDRDRNIPTTFRGYRERVGGAERFGERASPWAAVHDGRRGVAIAPRWFWQNFPAALEAAPGALALRLFPRSFAALHEIQGGEQKTHEFVISFGADALGPARGLSADPPLVRPTPATYAASGAIPYLTPRPRRERTLHDLLVDQALEGGDTFEMKRERVDEYGWRHFGELPADHEARFHEGEGEFSSHYNNQYDVVYGAFLQFARTGDARWHRIHEEMARHVIDIDVYHTNEDKPAYNQGLFWHTVHYVDADLSTHRSYPKRGSNGGGPDDEHNYTTGLVHFHLASGDALARETALASAEWVIGADDGERTIFRWLDRGRTGLASKTRAFDYHGPGRGAGNSINALLDGWRLTRDERFLSKAREILRRVVHPSDDFAKLDLLDAENRWSYTVCLQAIGKLLDVFAEAGRLDDDYAYARATLLAYARWMAEHERPILAVPEELEYPTETWAAQDVRKSDVFLFAALHAAGAERARFEERARYFFDRSLESLDGFPTKSCARAVILLMHYGLMQLTWNERGGESRPEGPRVAEFGRPARFVPQKTRALAKAKRLVAAGAVAAAAGAALLVRSLLR